MRLAFVLLAVLAIAGTAEATHASTPANITVVGPLLNDEPVVTWNSVSGTDEYRLTGTIDALRVNANDAFCVPPLAEDSHTLTLDETFEASVTQFELPLPKLPAEDAWYFIETSVTLEAFDSEGILLAAGNFALRMPDVGGNLNCATPTPPAVLPTTGSGGARADGRDSIAYFLATVTLAAALGAFALRRAVRG